MAESCVGAWQSVRSNVADGGSAAGRVTLLQVCPVSVLHGHVWLLVSTPLWLRLTLQLSSRAAVIHHLSLNHIKCRAKPLGEPVGIVFLC